MLVRRHSFGLASLAIGVAILLAFAGAGAALAQAPDKAGEQIRRKPMIFFVAKGRADSCGKGCGEWIAAEGTIDPGAAQRFRDFLARSPRFDLPIYFNSPGGNLGQAIELGRALREKRMTAGVGRTIPDACRIRNANDHACRRVMQAKDVHAARLGTANAACRSACVYTIAGASTRRLSGANVGVHAAHATKKPPGLDLKKAVADAHDYLRVYLVEMGVDPALVDLAASVRPSRIRRLTRDEIRKFNLDSRPYETRWLAHAGPRGSYFISKSLAETAEANGEHRTTLVRIACDDTGIIRVMYRRDLPMKEVDVTTMVRFPAGDEVLPIAASSWRTAGAWGYAATTLEAMQRIAARPKLEITEEFYPQSGPWSRVVILSTAGLAEGLAEMQKRCAAGKPLDAAAPSTSVAGGQ